MGGYRSIVVGLGQIGAGYDISLDPSRFVYSHARAFQTHPDFDLVAGVDTFQENRERFTKEYGVPSYPMYADAVNGVTPDLVAIAVPSTLHSSVVDEVLDVSPPKAILCEKPLSLDLTEARRIVHRCAEKNVRLFVNYIRRSEPGAMAVRKRIRDGAIGGPLKAVVWYSKGFLHNGSHLFNLLEFWLGECRGGKTVRNHQRTKEGDIEDDLYVEYSYGTAAFLSASEKNYSHLTVEIVAANGRLRYELGGRCIEWQEAIESKTLPGYRFLSDEVETIENGMDRYQWHVVDNLARSLRNQDASVCDGDAALRTLEIMMEIVGDTDEPE